MLTPTQLELLASCIEIGLEGAEQNEENTCQDLAMVEAVVTMIRELMPTIEENGGAILPLLGPNENYMIGMGLYRLAGVEAPVPLGMMTSIATFAAQWNENLAEFDAEVTTH